MERFRFRQILIFFLSLAVVAALIVGGVLFVLKNEKPQELKPAEPLTPPAGVSVTVPEQLPAVSSIIYNGNAFIPDRMTVDNDSKFGCLVLIENKSPAPLKIGLSPHRAGGDFGPQYEAIAPGGTLLFDPRFPGVYQLDFHNHSGPHEAFVLFMGKSCQI